MSLARTQQRRAKREHEKKQIKYYVSQQQLEDTFTKHKEEYRKEFLTETIESLSYMFAYAMYDELGIGSKRAKKVLERFCKDAMAFESGHLSMKDIIEFLNSKKIFIK